MLRHAKSSWKDTGLADHERPLNKRGRADAPRVGHVLKERGLAPDLILCSTAKRARQTAKRAVRAGGFRCPVELMDEIYLCEAGRLVEILRSVADSTRRVMLVGHNPGLEDLVESLTGEPATLPTAAVAHIELAVDAWSELGNSAGGRLVSVWVPREPD